jgi:hypothetical protein
VSVTTGWCRTAAALEPTATGEPPSPHRSSMPSGIQIKAANDSAFWASPLATQVAADHTRGSRRLDPGRVLSRAALAIVGLGTRKALPRTATPARPGWRVRRVGVDAWPRPVSHTHGTGNRPASRPAHASQALWRSRGDLERAGTYWPMLPLSDCPPNHPRAGPATEGGWGRRAGRGEVRSGHTPLCLSPALPYTYVC